MVRTKTAAKRVESGSDHDHNSNITRNEPARVPSPARMLRRQSGDSSKQPSQPFHLSPDIMFLLAGYIHPLDLFNLARTCKSHRWFLMDESSSAVWRAARSQVRGLPGRPTDLTEPEYACLVFYSRCHNCGKYEDKVFWALRRRYCVDCRGQRLCCFYYSSPDIIRQRRVLPVDDVFSGHDVTPMVDIQQMESFIRQYNDAPDKEQFLSESERVCDAICEHARLCADWESNVTELEQRRDAQTHRKLRCSSIFERLKQHGFEPEIMYFGKAAIKRSRRFFFCSSKPLSDQEWDQVWPGWIPIMNELRTRRLEDSVYKPRRLSLIRDYSRYLASSLLETPSVDLLPHVTDLVHFSLFRDIIYAPGLGPPLFERVFPRLPELLAEWRKQLDIDLAALVDTSSELLGRSTSSVSSSSATQPADSSHTADKLHLACAVFDTGSRALFTYPQVLFSCMSGRTLTDMKDEQERAVSLEERSGVKLLADAPYIIHACGLDPSVTTSQDMDRRNARLKCLTCERPVVRSWRGAMYHAFHCHKADEGSPSSRWELVNDQYAEELQATQTIPNDGKLFISELPTRWFRCMLCVPSVGNAVMGHDVAPHLEWRHGIATNAGRQDIHYACVSMDNSDQP